MNKIVSNLNIADIAKRGLKDGDIIFDGAKRFRVIRYNFLTGNVVLDSYGEGLIYKFFGPMSHSQRQNLKARIKILSKAKLSSIVKPMDMIIDSRHPLFFPKLTGVTTKKIEDMISLDDLSRDWRRDVEYFRALVNTSSELERIHNAPQKIILSDANFNNVLLQKNWNGLYINPKFIDIDSAGVKGHKTPWRSRYIVSYYDVIGKKYVPSANNDRLNYLLQFLYNIFHIHFGIIFDIKDSDFDSRAERIRSLKSIRSIFLDLKKGKVPYIPYFYEFLIPSEGKSGTSECSDYTVDDYNRGRIR